MKAADPIITQAGQASWRSQVLQGMLWVSTLTGIPVAAYVAAIDSRGFTRPAIIIAAILAVVIVLVACSRRWPFAVRAVIFIGVVYATGLLAVFYYGFTLGTGLIMLLTVVLCGLFFGQRWLWAGLLLTGASLASVGALHTAGVMATQRFDLLDLSQARTVVRMTLAYLVLAGTIGLSMSYVVRRIEESLRETSEALARFEAERRGRTEAENALRESEATYRHLVEDINDVIYTVDEKGILTYVSPAVEAHSGYYPTEMIGRVFSDFVYEADRNHVINQFTENLAGNLKPCEYRMVIKSGESRWIRSSSRPIYRGGQVVGLRGIYIDISEKRELEEQLRQAHKMEAMGTLAGGIAHEFNNMLSAILGFTDLAQRELTVNSLAWANLQHVLEAGRRAKDLVQQILVFSRQSAPIREPLSLAKVIQDVFNLLRASLPTTIDFQLHMENGIGMVLANPTQLHQVLMNLCSNAEYAMRETGGALTLVVDTIEGGDTELEVYPSLDPGPWIRLTVCDTGTGIPADIVNRIFDPFFTTKGIGEGTGMGLAIAHSIVASHGGRMTVESVPGEGTAFTLYFPQLRDQVTDEAELPSEELSRGTGRVLFVDDDEMLARLGKEMLEHLGYEVAVYTSGSDALCAFQADSQQFDAVITDQTMPVMTGASLVEGLRRVRPDIPIILCTGFSPLIDAEQARELGVDAFVMKPVVTQDLAAVLQQVLDQHAERKR